MSSHKKKDGKGLKELASKMLYGKKSKKMKKVVVEEEDEEEDDD